MKTLQIKTWLLILFITFANLSITLAQEHGKTHIVGKGGYEKVAKGISVAQHSDIILLNAGNYNEQITIDKPITLQATGDGYATIGEGNLDELISKVDKTDLEMQEAILIAELANLGVLPSDDSNSDFEEAENRDDDSSYTLSRELSIRAYPNPFISSTTLEFWLPASKTVNILVRDLAGKEVAVLAHKQPFQAGQNRLTFNAAQLPNGMYIVVLQTPNEQVIQKIILRR